MINLSVKLEVELDDSFFVDVLETAWLDGVSSWIEKYRFSKRANGKPRAEQIIKDGCIMYVLVDTGREIEETQITKKEDGSFIVSMNYPKDEWLYGYLLSYGPYAKVLEPIEIKEIIKERLKRAMEKYTLEE